MAEELKKLTLLWESNSLKERDWLLFLLKDFTLVERVDPSLKSIEEDCLVILSSNSTPLSSLRLRSVSEQLRSLTRVGLIHLSDEWYAGSYDVYGSFTCVLRTHYTPRLVKAGVLQIPLGWPGKPRHRGEIPQRDRRYLWCFVGNIMSSRFEMLRAFESLGPNFFARYDSIHAKPPLSKSEFDSLLLNSRFAPCPMGNVMLETWRLYEALEAGCIPIIEKRHMLDYFSAIFGNHPIPSFYKWSDAATYVRELSSNLAKCDSLQREIQKWWSDKRSGLQNEVSMYIRSRFDAGTKVSAPSPNSKQGDLVRQYLDLAKHHNLEAGCRRILIQLRRRRLARA